MFCVELQNMSFCFSASKSSVNWVWNWVRGKLVRSSCGFDLLRPRVCRVSIMLTTMLLLGPAFRRTNTSRAQRLLSLSPSPGPSLLNSSDGVQSSPPPVGETGCSSMRDDSHINIEHAGVRVSDKGFCTVFKFKVSPFISFRLFLSNIKIFSQLFSPHKTNIDGQ